MVNEARLLISNLGVGGIVYNNFLPLPELFSCVGLYAGCDLIHMVGNW